MAQGNWKPTGLSEVFDPLASYPSRSAGEELQLDAAARNIVAGTADEIDVDDSVEGTLTFGLSASVNAYSETVVGIGSQVAMVNATWKTVASITLAPGTYDIEGIVIFNGDATTVVSAAAAGISTADNTLPPTQYYGTQTRAATVPPINLHQVTPGRRVVPAASTTYYLVAFCAFGTANMNCYGTIKAHRKR